MVGFLTYPHVDQGDTGRRGAELLLRSIATGRRPVTALAKRPMLVPAESQALADPPMGRLRQLADTELGADIVDVSLFPVQPWLDVPELGFGVTVTSWGDPAAAQDAADRIADAAWEARSCFAVQVHARRRGGGWAATAARRRSGAAGAVRRFADGRGHRGQCGRHRRAAQRRRNPQLRNGCRQPRGGVLPCTRVSVVGSN